MAYIGRRPDEVFRAQADHDSFTGDGSTVIFDLSVDAPDNDADLAVFVDNVRQEPGSSKSYTIGADGSGNIRRITFVTAPAASAEIYVINPGRDTSLIDVADNAVTTAKIQDDAVTTAKILDSNVTAAKLASTLDISSKTITLPNTSVTNAQLAGSIANAKLTNSSITINGTAVSLGGSVTAGTDWQAVVVADGSTQLTAVAGRGYFLDTNAGVIEVKLPASPSRGDTFVFADYGNNFATNRVVIDTQGKLIDSTVGGVPDSDFILNTNGQVVEIVFADDTSGYIITKNSAPSDLSADDYVTFVAATGGTITTSGNFKIHTFTGDGCFVVSQAGEGTGTDVDYLVVAGAGGGGGDAGGGGGAGGFRASNTTCMPSPQSSPLVATTGIPVSATTFPITVGAGGTGHPAGASPAQRGQNGSNSVFSTITSAGGGGGGQSSGSPSPTVGDAGAGGSGGGGRGSGAPGAGNTPPVSPPQGNAGGAGPQGGAGGGGAGAAGTSVPSSPSPGGAGGIGSFMVSCGFAGCNGTPGPVSGVRYFAGGGGGSGDQTGVSGGAGGSGGGGPGQGRPSSTPGVAGTANTGGGAGGGAVPSGGSSGGAGGKGIVILRYKFQKG